MGKRLGLVACLVCALAATGSRAEAQFGPQPPHQLFYQSTTVARLNPLGLISFFQMGYRKRLYLSNSVFVRDNYFGIGVTGSASPAFGRGGLLVELQPVPFVRLWASYEAVGYFGTFDFLPSFQNADGANWSDSALGDASDAGRNYPTTGTQLTVSGTLQARVGPAVLRSVLRATRPDYDLRRDDEVFYDVFYDILMANRGWMTTNDLDAFYIHQDRWTVGVRYTWSRSYMPDRVFSDPMNPGNDVVTHRLGPVLVYTFFQKYKARYNGPSILFAVNWWLKHPYRTGQDVSQAFPYVLLGFSFQGDLLAPPSRDDDD
ncbi:MAG: hypothetical protein H6721_24580 [Sandaracinus sp.]|nr:hypothetical protein [Sandaracinus sp.]